MSWQLTTIGTRAQAVRQVTLRLDSDVIDRFRAGGPEWQGRINEG